MMTNGDMTDIEMLGKFKGIVQTEINHLKVDIADVKNTVNNQDHRLEEYVARMNEIVNSCRAEHRQDFVSIYSRLGQLESFKDKVYGSLIVLSLLVTTAWGKILGRI